MPRHLVPFGSRLPRSLDALRREMDDLFDSFFGLAEGGEPIERHFTPRVNLAETENEYEVSVELPGLKPEDFDVELNGNELWISGERKQEQEEKGKTFHRIERVYGKFRRTLPLPGDVEADKIEAEYKDGVLRVVVPKAAAAKPKRIQVKS